MQRVPSTFVPAPMERVFDVSLDVDAPLESMSETGERAVAGVASTIVQRR